jgi:5'-3' exonuclease
MTDLIVDANSLYARSWYAAQNISSDPLEAIRLSISTVLLLLNPGVEKIGVRFDRTLFAWDGRQNPLKNREEKPPEYHETKSVVQDVLAFLFDTVNYQHNDYEGDDIVATAVFSAEPQDTVYVVSADKDLQQLLQADRCHYYCLSTKALLTRSFITRKWHVHRPSQIALALAIIGDQVDKIAGIKGYGPVKCKQLFEAVTPSMTFEQAMQAITRQIPVSKLDEFYAALDRTLLKTDVPGVPAPARLRLQDPREVRKIGVPNIGQLYSDVYEAYQV